MRIRTIALGLVSVLALAAEVSAAPPEGWDPVKIGQGLLDPATKDQALARIAEWFRVDPVDGAKELRRYWGKPLSEGRCYGPLLDWSLQGILAAPQDTDLVCDLLQLRVQTLLSQKKPQEALVEAKRMFNVARSKPTATAISLLADCLEKTRPDDVGIYDRFRQEQVTGAREAGMQCDMVVGIRVDAGPYSEAIAQRKHVDITDGQEVLGLLNLQLLANQLEQARDTLNLVSRDNERQYVESTARLMKAEDGTIGRANGYLLGQVP